ncbi:uncharacterized protein LOC142339585 isoform X1 [Convolutriloba macropyga]|uniref:uncharacterized protein LOC142339585 isoform X1 n=1 Tax=Convolutriloba macropyga TaxID=536237 RepID=UPI003F524688
MVFLNLIAIKCWFLSFTILAQGFETSETNEKLDSKTQTRPYHIAFVSGCDSHLFILLPTAFSLLRKSSSPHKYRATFVIGAECQKTAMNLGDDVGFHDTGRWMYPNYDPSISVAEYYENVTLGSVIHPYEGTLSLAEKDKPDLIIAEAFSVGATIVAEKYNIPMLFQFTPGVSHISTWTESPKGGISIGTVEFFDPETTPQLALRFIAAASFSGEILLCWHYCRAGKQVFDKLRQDLDLGEPFDSYNHVLSSYPSFTTVGEPISQMFDVPPKFTVTGLLPSPPETLPVSDELRHFLDQSSRPVLYVSMGTYFVFSDEIFAMVKNVLEEQDKFNVVWSHRMYDAEKMVIRDKTKMLILKKVPQKFVLNHENVRVYLTHCGISSVKEGLAAGVAFLTAPQGRDQFYIAARVVNAHLGIHIGTTPDRKTLENSIEQIYQNLDQYSANVRAVYAEMSKGSVAKLEKLVDSLILQGRSTKFDQKESLIWSWNQSLIFAIWPIALTLFIFLLITKAILYVAVKLIDRAFFAETGKTKTQ